MAPPLASSFEGGTNGTTLTSGSGGNTVSGGSYFDVVSVGTGCTCAFSTTGGAHGSLSCHFATGSTSASTYVAWNTSLGTVTTHWGRVYLTLGASPPTNNDIFVGFKTASGSWNGGIQVLQTTANLRIQLPSFATNVWTSTTALAANTLYRVEWELVNSTTAGGLSVSLYAGDSTTALETFTATLNLNWGTNTTGIWFGWPSNVANQTDLYLDDIAVSTTGALGPSGVTVTPGAVAATTSFPAPTVTGGATVTPTVVAATTSILTPTVTTGDATVAASTVTATCGFPAPTVAGGASVRSPQLSNNPQFTGASTTGWTGFNGSLTGSSSPPAGCPEATAVQYVNGGTSAGAIEGTTWWAAQPSTQYTMSAWVYTTSPNVQIGFNWENAAGTYVGNSLTGSVSVPASTWTLVTTTQTSNAAAAKGIARVGATGLSETIWATDINAWLPSVTTLACTSSIPTPTVTTATTVTMGGALAVTTSIPTPTVVTADATVTMGGALAVTSSIPAATVLTPDARAFPATLTCTASFPAPTVVVNSALVGVYLGGGMGVGGTGISFTSANAMWQGWTGTSAPAARYYLAASTFSYQTNMQQMVAAGTKICLTVRPAYNPVSATDLANLTTLMTTLKAAGAVVDVALWHEPYYQGLTSAQFIAMWNYYAPTVQAYYPTVFVPNVASLAVHGEGAYYPGDTYVDKVCVDIYDSQYKTGQNMAAAAAIADGAIPPKPFGVWEFDGSTDPYNGQSQTDVTTFFSYVQSFMTARLTAGKVNADVLLFPSLQSNWLGNVTVPNAGMTGGIGNWAEYPSTGNCSVAPSATAHSPGSGSMAMTSLASGAMMAYCNLGATSGQPVTAGTSIVGVQAWFKAAASARTCQVNLLWYTSGGTYISTTSGTPVTSTTTGWTQLALSGVTAPATAAFALPEAQVNGTGGASEVHYVTDVNLWVSAATSPAQCNVLVFGWDYRIGLWESLYTALNGVGPTGVNSYAYPATVAATCAFPAPTVAGGAVAAPATLAVTTTCPAPTVQGGANPLPTVLAATSTFPPVTASGGAVTIPATVAATTSFPTVAASGGALTVPATLAVTTTCPAPTVQGGANPLPSTVTATSTFPAASVVTLTIAAPATVTATSMFPAPTVAGGAVAAPATLAVTSSIPTPSVTTTSSSLATPAAVAVTSTVGAPAVSGGAVAGPAVLACTTTRPAPTVQGGANPLPAVVAATTSIPTPQVRQDQLVSPATVAGTAGFPAATAGGGAVAVPVVLAVTATVPVPVVAAGATPLPSTVAATSSFPGPAASGGALASPAALTATAGFPAPSVQRDATSTPATVTVTTTIPAPTVAGGANPTPAAKAVTTSFPPVTVTGGATAGPAALTATASFLAPQGSVAVTMPALFPDIEQILTRWLPGQLAAVYGTTARVVAETPYAMELQVPLVRLYRTTGSDISAIIDKPVISVDSYGQDRASASLLARQVHNLLHFQFQGTVTGGAVAGYVNTVAGPRWLPYADLAVRRFNATYEINLHAAPATV